MAKKGTDCAIRQSVPYRIHQSAASLVFFDSTAFTLAIDPKKDIA
jgi:hypothetical protein